MWRITGGSTSSNSSVGCTSFFPKIPLTFDVVPFQSLKSSGFRSIHVNPHYWKRSSSSVPSFFRPICWMATERSSDGEILWFSTCSRPSNLEALPLPLSWTLNSSVFQGTTKVPKSLWNSLLFRSGMCFFSVFILGLGICGKHRQSHVFRQFTRLFAV